jgi:hypothetical protein
MPPRKLFKEFDVKVFVFLALVFNLTPNNKVLVAHSDPSPYDPNFCFNNFSNSVVYISVNDNEWLHYELQSNITYCVIKCATGSILDLIAKNVSYHDWIVVFSLPTLFNLCEIRIFQFKGCNGVIVLNVPTARLSLDSYQLTLDKELPSGFGIIEIANLQLRVTNLEHFLVNSPTALNVHIKSSPGDADLVFHLPSSSFVSVDNFSNNILVKGANLILSKYFFYSNFTMLLVGRGSTSAVDMSQAQSVSYLKGCLKVPDINIRSNATNASAWFKQQTIFENVSMDLLQCPLATYQIGELAIATNFIQVQGLGVNKSCSCLKVQNGDVALLADEAFNKTENWTTVWLNSTALTVENDFEVHFTQGRRVFLPSTVFNSEHARLNIVCNNELAVLSTQWFVGCSQTRVNAVIAWKCDNGGVFCPDANIKVWNWPVVNFVGNPRANVIFNMTLNSRITDGQQRNVTISATDIAALFHTSAGLAKKFNIYMSDQMKVTQFLQFQDGSNIVTVDESALAGRVNTTTLIVPPSASCNLSAPLDVSISLPGNLLFTPQNRSIRSQPMSGSTSCFQPVSQCTEANWLDVVYGRNPRCWVDFSRECQQQATINLVTQNSIHCWFESSVWNQRYWTLPIYATSEQVNDTWKSANPGAIFLLPIVFYFVALTVTMTVWLKFRVLVDSGWSFIFFTALLQLYAPLLGTFARVIVNVGAFVVDLQDGPECYSLVRLIIFSITILLCFIVILVAHFEFCFRRKPDLYSGFRRRCHGPLVKYTLLLSAPFAVVPYFVISAIIYLVWPSSLEILLAILFIVVFLLAVFFIVWNSNLTVYGSGWNRLQPLSFFVVLFVVFGALLFSRQNSNTAPWIIIFVTVILNEASQFWLTHIWISAFQPRWWVRFVSYICSGLRLGFGVTFLICCLKSRSESLELTIYCLWGGFCFLYVIIPVISHWTAVESESSPPKASVSPKHAESHQHEQPEQLSGQREFLAEETPLLKQSLESINL